MSPFGQRLFTLVAGCILCVGFSAYCGQDSSGDGYAGSMAALKSGNYGVEDLKRMLLDSANSASLDAVQERAYLNEVMNALRRTADPDDGVEEALVAVASDSGRDPGVREYALQHLGLWGKAGAQFAEATDALWDFTEDPTLSSAAILQLHHLGGARLRGREAWGEVLAWAMNRENLRDADKVTLLLVSAESGAAEALPKAKAWALAAKDTVLLKCAIHAVGTLGTQEDLKFLDGLKTRKDLKDVEIVWAKARQRLKEGGER